MTYKCLPVQNFQGQNGYSIVPLRKEDMETIRLWRNAQIDILRQKSPLSAEEQKHYFDKILVPSFEQPEPSQILFSYLLNNQFIGYGGLTHIDWQAKRGEISFLIDPEIHEANPEFYEKFLQFLSLLSQVAFKILSFNKLTAEVYAFRAPLIAILEEFGFQQEGRLRAHVMKQDKLIDSFLYGLLKEDPSYMRHPKKEITGALSSPYFRNSSVTQEAVLITSIASKVPLIEAVRRSLTGFHKELKIYGCDSNENALGRYFVDSFWHSPLLKELQIEEVIQYCRTHSITSIIPTRNEDTYFYATHLKKLQDAKIYVMVSSLDTIKKCLDKKLFADFLASSGLLAIPTELVCNAIPSEKVVVKERFGAGSINIGCNLLKDAAQEHARTLKEPIFQPYIEGQELSIDMYRSKKGHILGAVARERTIVMKGESQVTTTVENKLLLDLCKKAAEKLDVYGHVIFQVLQTQDNHLYIIECNPRFGGASTISLKAGLNSFLWFFLENSESTQEMPLFHHHTQSLRQVRHAVDKVILW